MVGALSIRFKLVTRHQVLFEAVIGAFGPYFGGTELNQKNALELMSLMKGYY
jgi:hypothetical protein